VRARTGFKVGAVVDLVYTTIADVVAIIAKNSRSWFCNLGHKNSNNNNNNNNNNGDSNTGKWSSRRAS
jgi:hypothetical protein